MFTPGQIYRRRDLHAQYGGQQQGGISTPQSAPIIFIFTGDTGTQHGYADTWMPDGTFRYTGEGQVGDMQFVRGNLALRDHLLSRKDLHLFATAQRSFVRYIGQMVVTGYEYAERPDSNGNLRQAIVFALSPVGDLAQTEAEGVELVEAEPELARLSLLELRQRALGAVAPSQKALTTQELYHYRSQWLHSYVLARANGACEGCRQKAPFLTDAGVPYLEVHHINKLSDVGPDEPLFVAAVCPNCHQRAHHSDDRQAFSAKLEQYVRRREDEIADLH